MYQSQTEFISTDNILQEYDELLACNALGFYNCCEMTSIFLHNKQNDETYNIYTIFTFEERFSFEAHAKYLTSKLVPITEHYSLGVYRRLCQKETVRAIIESLCVSRNLNVVDIGNGELQIGKLEAVPKAFVPCNSTVEILLNRVLKNNILNGSYILEFFDVEKRLSNVLQADTLKKMTDAIFKVVPIDLISVTDRIGNFIFQFPSINVGMTYITDKFEQNLSYSIHADKRLGENFEFALQAELNNDGLLVGFGTRYCRGIDAEVVFNVGNTSPMCRSTIIDTKDNLILSQRETAFMRQVKMLGEIRAPYSPYREIYDDNGNIQEQIEISSLENISTPEPIVRKRNSYINSRAYKHRVKKLYETREFRSYGKVPEIDKETQDVITLMERGKGGEVSLWDPYLTVEDLLRTWYHTTVYGMKLRAITSEKAVNKFKKIEGIKTGEVKETRMTVPEWIEAEQAYMEKSSNHYGICAELRCQWKQHGYGFHDRFLIIEMPLEPPTVWSLGTSLNSLGKKHNIIQSVTQPQMILDAFNELWSELECNECLVWKCER